MRKPMNPILTAVAVSGALSLLLGAAAGTQTDPLVTLSYLNDVNTPAILKEVDARLDTREQALVDKLNASSMKRIWRSSWPPPAEGRRPLPPSLPW